MHQRLLDRQARPPSPELRLDPPLELLPLHPECPADGQADQDEDRHHQRRPRRVPPAPPPGALQRADPPRLDRPPLHEPPHVLDQCPRVGVPPPRIFVQALQADRLQVARHLRVQPRGRHRLLGDHLPLRLRGRLSPERRPPGEHLVEDGAERVDVRGGPDRSRLADHLLGGHVAGRAHPSTAQGQGRLSVEVPRQPEIGDLGRAVGGEQDVGRLQIAVHDPALVGRLHGLGQRGQQRGRLAGRLRRARQGLGQAAPLDELHGEVRPALVVAHVVDLDDVRVPQARHRLRFALEPRPLVRPGVGAGEQHLEGDEAVEPQVPGLVDDAHAPAAEQGLHLIAGDPRQVGARCRARRRDCPGVGNIASSWASTARICCQRRRTSGSSSGQAPQTSSGVHPESQISSSSRCTRGSSATARFLEAAACHDADTRRTHILPACTWLEFERSLHASFRGCFARLKTSCSYSGRSSAAR